MFLANSFLLLMWAPYTAGYHAGNSYYRIAQPPVQNQKSAFSTEGWWSKSWV